MWEISEVICLVFMMVLSVMDIRIRKVPLYLLLAAGFMSTGYHMLSKDMDWQLVLGGMTIGMIFLLISKVTRENIGYGDSIGIVVLGIYLGLWRVITVISLASFLLLFVLIPVMIRKKMSRRTTLPFYPFLAGGYLWMIIMEGIRW